jgi:hypothetical protein
MDADKPASPVTAAAIKETLDGLAGTGKAAREALPLLERAKALLGRLRA